MVDPIVINVNTEPVKQMTAAIDEADAAQKRAAASADEYARAQEMIERHAQSIQRRNPGRSLEDIIGNMHGPASATIKKYQEGIEGAAKAHEALNAEVDKGKSAFSGFLGNLLGYGQAHEEVAHKVEHATHSHSLFKEAAHEVQHAIHALHPVLATAGTGMGELSGLAMAARGGFAALAAAVGGTFLAEIIKAGAEIQNLKREFNDVFGTSGPEMFNKTRHAAEELHTSMDKFAPSVEGAYRTIQKERFGIDIEGKSALEQSGVSFAPGAGGEAAMRQMIGLNATSLFGADSKVGQDVQKLSQLFQIAGESAGTAATKASSFFLSIPKSSEEARESALKTAEGLNKLFQASGRSADESTKATTEFLSSIKKGLNAEEFDKIAGESDKAARMIAKGFGFDGPEAVGKFAAALDKVGSVSFMEFLTAMSNVHHDIEHLEVPDTVTQGWDKLKHSWHELFEGLAEKSNEKDGSFSQVLKGISEGIDSLKPHVIEEFDRDLRALVETGKELKEWYQWFQSLTPTQVNSTTAGIAVGGAAGALVGGPVGALVGGSLGGAAGAYLSQPGGSADTADFTAPSGEVPDLTQMFGGKANSASASVNAFADDVKKAGDNSGSASSSVDQLSISIAALGDAAVATSQSTGSGGGGGSPSFDATADVGSNATGGVYMVGGGGTNPAPQATGGTDSISLKGSVSPGEIVAVIPADKANQATLSTLQDLISTSPISIGGGNVSGTGESGTADSSGVNLSLASSIVAGASGGTPIGLDPAVRNMLQQLRLMTMKGYTGGLGLGQGGANGLGGSSGGGFSTRPSREDQQRPETYPSVSSGGGAAPVSRAARANKGASVMGPMGIKEGGHGGHGGHDDGHGGGHDEPIPIFPDMFPEYLGAGPYTGGSQDLYDENFSSYNLPYTDQYYNPWSAYSGGGIGSDTGSDWSATGNYYQYSGPSSYAFDNSSYVDSSNFDYLSSYSSSSFPSNDDFVSATSAYASPGSSPLSPDESYTVDIGSNATGGVYTIGGPGEVSEGESGKVDALTLVGKVSPGEIVAVIPKQKATQQAVQRLSSLVSGSGGGPKGLSLSGDQITALMNQIMRMYRLQQQGQNGLSGSGGGGFSTRPSKDAQGSSPQQSSSGGGGAARTSRAAAPNNGASVMGQMGIKEQYSSNYYPSEYMGAGPYTGGGQDLYDPNFSSYNLYPNDYYYDPYSAYPGGGIGVDTGQDWSPTGNYYQYPGDFGGSSSYDYSFDNSSYVNSNFDYFGSEYAGGGGGWSDDYASSAAYGSMGMDYSSASSGWDTGGSGGGDYSGWSDFSTFAGDLAGGGSFVVPRNPGGGTDTVPTRMNLTGGELVSVFPEDMQRPGGGSTLPTAYAPQPSSIGGDQGSDRSAPSGGHTFNIFGATNPQQFLQSRMAIQRSMRYV